MLLALDIGNTNITAGVFEGEQLKATCRMATDPRRMGDEYSVLLLSMLHSRGISQEVVTETVMCSVVPPLTGTLEDVCQTCFGIRPLVVGAGVKTGVRVLYDNPKDVGADRIVDAAAAYRLYGGPVISVDIGTATVFDAISKDGNYVGGAIAPGIMLAAESLFQNTSQLRRVELIAPSSAIGKNTITAMQSGLILGYVDLIEGMIRRFKLELGLNSKVVATGGLAPIMDRETDVFDEVNLDLTLHGLRMIYDMNEAQ